MKRFHWSWEGSSTLRAGGHAGTRVRCRIVSRDLGRLVMNRYAAPAGRGAGTGGNREKNFNRDSGIFWGVKQGPQFYGVVDGDRDVWRWSVARSIYLLISGVGTSTVKRDPKQ